MKNAIFLFTFMSAISLNLFSQKTIKVDNAKQFVEAIGNDRVIQLQGSTIYLSELTSETSGQNYRFNEEFDGYELCIFGASNLKIVGLGNKPVKIITQPLYGDVIFFENCKNITIENVDAGHGPEKGNCSGGVFNFSDCSNINIVNSIMYGSGIEGITGIRVDGLKCTNSVIRGCTYSILSIQECKNFIFTDCEFSDNKEFDLINIDNCSSIKFNKCTIANNSTGKEDYSSYALLNIKNSSQVVFQDSKFESNSTIYFCTDPKSFELKNTKKTNNSFYKGEFKE